VVVILLKAAGESHTFHADTRSVTRYALFFTSADVKVSGSTVSKLTFSCASLPVDGPAVLFVCRTTYSSSDSRRIAASPAHGH